MPYSQGAWQHAEHETQRPDMVQALQGAHIAGQNNGNFWYAQGNASANILSNGYGIAHAGHGADQAVAIVPPQQVYIDRHHFTEVPETRSKFKSKRTWMIICLIVGLLVVCGAVVAGVAVHEIHKQSA